MHVEFLDEASGSDFGQLQLLVDTAIECGAEAQFNHAGLNPATLSVTFSSIASYLHDNNKE